MLPTRRKARNRNELKLSHRRFPTLAVRGLLRARRAGTELYGCLDLLTRRLGIVYPAALPRTAHARAVSEINPSVAVGMRSLMRSRSRALSVSPSDIA